GQSGLKSVQATVPMQYNDGDQLIFKCFSGTYKSVTPLIPVQSQTVTSNFVACTDADDNNYATVTVGSQVWMAENLNVGIRIDGVQEQTNNGINEKYCYNNDVTKCDIYGGLYQWHEIMQYVITPGVQGICPTGWHIPTDEEWFILTIFLGGDSIAGGKIKSTGTIEAGTGLWHDPNTEAANAYGLTAVPGSYRDLDGTFYGIGYYSIWWSSFQSGNDSAWVRVLDYNYGGVSRDDDDRSYGFSVRCLKE
ncbi:MAG: fibrobacter succinogenes major paralogous domain-containing protein, partial [Bacteroidales bacterium]|nr:fibrobacter succinogenes major paralogous domain-containing protein [Bacteroidales bacterium]